MLARILLIVLILPLRARAAEDSATFIQMLTTMIKVLETTERALDYDKYENTRLALETWQSLGGSSTWKTLDGGLSLNLIGSMSEISFNDGSQSHTIGFDIAEAINAIKNKGFVNLRYANDVIKIQTESIKNDAEILRQLSRASKSPKGNLQAMQVLLQLTLQNIQQMRQVRSQMAFDSQTTVNFEAERRAKEDLRHKKTEEFLKFNPPQPESSHKRY